MALFLGYDPGGKAKNGVAAIRVASDAIEVLKTATVLDASEALSWLKNYASSAQALGVDTLLAWSKGGTRLRRRTPKQVWWQLDYRAEFPLQRDDFEWRHCR